MANLIKQGPLLTLSIQEGQDLTWKSFAFNLKKGLLKFVLNATLDTLPTKANLLQWKKSCSDRCPLCKGRQTSVHVLSACPVSRNQQRLTWRHDGIIQYIADSVDTAKYKCYADIPGRKTSVGGTMPPEILLTPDRPDLVIIDYTKKIINTFELTVPYEHNIEQRNVDKNNRYAYMKSDITDFTPNITAFEIGARGYISKENRGRLRSIYSHCKKNISFKIFEQNIAKLALYGSYHIYLCRDQSEWSPPPLLTV